MQRGDDVRNTTDELEITYSIQCPKCKMAPRYYCRTLKTWRTTSTPHTSRRKLAKMILKDNRTG